jgi:DnaK suppressor protein
MTNNLTGPAARHDVLREFALRLRKLRAELQADIREDLEESEHQSFSDLVGEVRDSGDESNAELAAGSERAVLSRHADALNDVDGALKRITDGSYGMCIDCNGEINTERLSAYPTAKRCIACQVRCEKQHAGNVGTSL